MWVCESQEVGDRPVMGKVASEACDGRAWVCGLSAVGNGAPPMAWELGGGALHST